MYEQNIDLGMRDFHLYVQMDARPKFLLALSPSMATLLLGMAVQ